MINLIEEEEAGVQVIENMTISSDNRDQEIIIEMKREETVCLLQLTLEIVTLLIDLKIGIDGNSNMEIMTGETMLTGKMSIIGANLSSVEDEVVDSTTTIEMEETINLEDRLDLISVLTIDSMSLLLQHSPHLGFRDQLLEIRNR